MEKYMSTLWNQAVSEVGTMQNTRENFVNISKKFKSLAYANGYAREDIEAEINSNWQATHLYMRS